MAVIELKNMEFHAHHGCWDFEKEQGNRFIVSLEMELDTTRAECSDDLTDTLNYQAVYDVVKREMEIPSNLIEHVGRRIYNAVKNSFPQIERLQITLSKTNPPLGGTVECVSVKL